MKEILNYTWKQFDKDMDIAAEFLLKVKPKIKGIYGIPRGGLVVAVALSHRMNIPMFLNYNNIKNKSYIIVVDDISDTGKTFKSLPKIEKHLTYAIFNREKTKFLTRFIGKMIEKEWVHFCWENRNAKQKRDGTIKNGK
jgi:uncharacterized protein